MYKMHPVTLWSSEAVMYLRSKSSRYFNNESPVKIYKEYTLWADFIESVVSVYWWILQTPGHLKRFFSSIQMAKTELLRVKSLPCIGKKTFISLVLNFAELKIWNWHILHMFRGWGSYRSYLNVKVSVLVHWEERTSQVWVWDRLINLIELENEFFWG